MTTVLIDNYDSFTYNVYQYLSSQGADVVVYRNDKITVEEIEDLNPRNIVISPGPGHPSHDAGISRDVISHFAGKLPILGICMGEQCVYEVFGGTVSYAGDIVHGKTSRIKHDGRGIFKGVPQETKVTRYHSLAGVKSTLPAALEVTATADEDVIMAIRHKEYTIEGVQFHPESILCDHGKIMIANFLKLEGGYWAENSAAGVIPKKITAPSETTDDQPPASGPSGNTEIPSILQRIYNQRRIDVQAAKEIPGQSEEDFKKLLKFHAPLPLQDFVSRLQEQPLSLMAEVKRASPSKGEIDIKANAAEQALKYAQAGASVISVLTEPKWFRGSLSDMKQVRHALSHLPRRPCILRKDFIVDTYQILEARLYGADTVLLIVAMLSQEKLSELYAFSKSLGMEPLVEVNNAEEMARANELGARVIGVNNRNLHSFDVDMETTSRLASMVPENTILCALSGISSRTDVETYVAQGVRAVLVGEALMRAWNLQTFVDELLGIQRPEEKAVEKKPTLVKICGISSVEAAVESARSGADMIGLIFAEKSRRKVSLDDARAIVQVVRALEKDDAADDKNEDAKDNAKEEDKETDTLDDSFYSLSWFEIHSQLIARRPRKPLVVGVFVNQSISYMTHVAEYVGLDLIQLHGTESVETARYLPRPVIRAFHMNEETFHDTQIPLITQPSHHHAVLLDAGVTTRPSDEQGGLGVTFDWNIAKEVVQRGLDNNEDGQRLFPIILAGGLDPTNVAEAITKVQPWAVDVSSGVETDKKKDLEKIRLFIEQARSVA